MEPARLVAAFPGAAPEVLAALESASVSVAAEPGPDTQVLVDGGPSAETLDRLRNLRAVVIPWAGVPPATGRLVAERPALSLHNLHHNAPETGEMAVALLMAAAKTIVPADQRLRQGDWGHRYENRNLRLDGRTAVVLGFGAIGQVVGRACRGMGMRVIGVARSARTVDGFEVRAAADLHALLPEADALVCTLPGTPHTEGLVGPAEIALLPPTAIVVNVGRGSVIDAPALYAALSEGRIHSAGLDVWWRYPGDPAATFPADVPFHELDNVVLSPHRGGASIDSEAARQDHLRRLLAAFAEGDWTANRIDLDLGY